MYVAKVINHKTLYMHGSVHVGMASGITAHMFFPIIKEMKLDYCTFQSYTRVSPSPHFTSSYKLIQLCMIKQVNVKTRRCTCSTTVN